METKQTVTKVDDYKFEFAFYGLPPEQDFFKLGKFEHEGDRYKVTGVPVLVDNGLGRPYYWLYEVPTRPLA